MDNTTGLLKDRDEKVETLGVSLDRSDRDLAGCVYAVSRVAV
jgi:hypothetical protein